eukprot:14000245-Ditylum_brightwellii.AAC.1
MAAILFWSLVALKITSEAGFGGTSVGPQWLIVDFLQACFAALLLLAWMWQLLMRLWWWASTMAFTNNPILFPSPYSKGREKQKANIAGIMGIVVEEGVFGPYYFRQIQRNTTMDTLTLLQQCHFCISIARMGMYHTINCM